MNVSGDTFKGERLVFSDSAVVFSLCRVNKFLLSLKCMECFVSVL